MKHACTNDGMMARATYRPKVIKKTTIATLKTTASNTIQAIMSIYICNCKARADDATPAPLTRPSHPVSDCATPMQLVASPHGRLSSPLVKYSRIDPLGNTSGEGLVAACGQAPDASKLILRGWLSKARVLRRKQRIDMFLQYVSVSDICAVHGV